MRRRDDRRGSARRAPGRRGLGQAEVLVSAILVGMTAVGAMRAVGAAVDHRRQLADDRRASLLADSLAAEIYRQEYVEPSGGGLFGMEMFESDGTRRNFDDVDDYHGLDEAPPKLRDGTPVTDPTGWRRTVRVEYADPSAPASTVSSDLGLKRFTVEVYRGGRLLSTKTGLRRKADKA